MNSPLPADKHCPVEREIGTHLQSQNASGCMLAALTALSWIKQSQKNCPAALKKLLLGALSKTKADRVESGSLQIYAEFLPQYQQAQGALANLMTSVGSLFLPCKHSETTRTNYVFKIPSEFWKEYEAVLLD